MANPVGEDDWLAFLEEATRNANSLERRAGVVTQYKRAVADEPGSLRIWRAYCDYYWSLWLATRPSGDSTDRKGWSEEDRINGRQLFMFDSALELWQKGYESIKYRLNDSHVFWDRWLSLEMDLLSRSKTPEGIKRITHLFRNRLTTPHLTWDETSQRYSSFLNEYSQSVYEDSMKDITLFARDVKRLIAARDPFESRLAKAARDDSLETQKAVMAEYLEWEMVQSKRNNDQPEIGLDLCLGLYSRALTDIFAHDEDIWYGLIVFVSSAFTSSQMQSLEVMSDILRRAVRHCPWSGCLWSRYILCAEEAKLDFADIEAIKHSATSSDQLYKHGMESMIQLYVAWCGFLKRNAMSASAKDEAVDVADVGLIAALEDVAVVGRRLYGKDFQGDPKFRLERIFIQYLTEKKGAIGEARAQWNKLASSQMHADNHDFWLRFYVWEMLVFSAHPASNGSPQHMSQSGVTLNNPTLATEVLARAAHRRTVDWPERILEVYLQHCNDYETPAVIRKATDSSHNDGKRVRVRREREEQEMSEAYTAFYGASTQPEVDTHLSKLPHDAAMTERKRKAESGTPFADAHEDGKRRKTGMGRSSGQPHQHSHDPAEPKRDRENSTILVDNLPLEVTQTRVRQYFKEYGHINNITALVRYADSHKTTALIEFSTPVEAQSALLRDGKYFDERQLCVTSGHDLTIYLTNYPPAADQSYIRDLFQDCGEILSIRWPSLQVNAHRRFCYVSFRNRQASAHAVAKDGTLIDGHYRILAKYSDPLMKKRREGAISEGREVRVSNLDRGVDENELRQVFSKIGAVVRVNIPRSLSGKSRGVAYLNFEDKDTAQRAVEQMDNVKVRSQVIKAEISKETKIKPSAKISGRGVASGGRTDADEAANDIMSALRDGDSAIQPNAADIQARTIALLGLPDTINVARVEALVRSIGPVVQLKLQPAHGGAKIEFSDAALAGKAALELDGANFEGRRLRIGTLEDLRLAKAESTPDRIIYGYSRKSQVAQAQGNTQRLPTSVGGPAHMPPLPITRRPILGNSRHRRAVKIPSTAKISNVAAAESTTAVKSSKTNDDFRAMFQDSSKVVAHLSTDGDIDGGQAPT